MVDTVTKIVRSDIMRTIKNKDSKVEVRLRKRLWSEGLRYRKNSVVYFGKPDVVLRKYQMVVFVDSCFWHGHPTKCRLPNSNTIYWKNKIAGNKARDKVVNKYYKQKGWAILRFWDYQIENNIDFCIKKIKMVSQSRGKNSVLNWKLDLLI